MQRYSKSSPPSKWSIVTLLAISLVLLGGLYIAWGPFLSAWQRLDGARHNATNFRQAKASITQVADLQLGTPRTITLPRLNIALPVTKGTYNSATRTWTIDREHAFYIPPRSATSTPVIYGHAIPTVFMRLSGVAPDEILYIANSKGQLLLFHYVDDTTLSPNDDSILHTYYPNTIVLLTCSGTYFQYRHALRFVYAGMQQSLLASSERI